MEVIPALMILSSLNKHFRSKLKFIFYLDFTYSTAIVAIPYILRENLFDFFETEGADHPRIQCDKPLVDINVIIDENARFNVMVERFRLSSGKDFVKMFGVLMASFYIFNLECNPKLEGSFIFFQKLLLNINDRQKTPSKVEVDFLFKKISFI